jgi:hypothetical protein
MVSTLTFALLASALPATLANYTLAKDYFATEFFSNFDFFTGEDPTHGFVKYVDENTANSTGLVGYAKTEQTPYAAYLGVDMTNVAPQGRPSVRILSKDTYNHVLVVADFGHMAFGAGVWPAFWALGTSSPWPAAGEIDIVEGVNSQSSNRMTLHTNAGVTLANATSMTGDIISTNCDISATSNNQGCTIVDPNSAGSFGEAFNKNGGGVFATEYTSEAIKIWFFPRGNIPSDVSGPSPNPSGWGTPNAFFSSADQPLDEHFCELRIILNIDLCGDWAGNPAIWSADPASSYAPTCNELVENSPEAMTEAYWAVNSLKVFQNPSQGLGSKKRSVARRHGGAVLPKRIASTDLADSVEPK